MKNKILPVYLLLAMTICIGPLMAQTGTARSPLKVLFVGYDPAKPMPNNKRVYPGSEKLFEKEYPVRMPAFKKLLSGYFREVKTIDCRDWKSADSDPYDVTIFDFTPRKLEPAKTEKDAGGKEKYAPARYLPDNFSKPVIFIGATAPIMGERLGVKLDWLCYCLNSDAHHIQTQHAIFKGPLERVTPTMVMKKTPDDIYHYKSGDTVPKEIPMWRVNIPEAYGGGTPIGMVSRGNRFAEGPDAEMISSGVCLKDVGAVALGRHGNFFLWGFGASPADMTEEAKKVFVNAVAYMKQFDGKLPIARKYNTRIPTTDDVREIVAHISKESYESYCKDTNEYNEKCAEEKKQLEDKKAGGQALTQDEEKRLAYLQHVQKIDTWEEYLKERMGKDYDRFGADVNAYQQYMKSSMDYIYCDADGSSYYIDEDVQKIGISNHSVKLLDACIAMLKKNDQPEFALRVLRRYTGENFTTAKEWGNWLSKNRKKLFFSETDGYRFLINTYAK